MLSPDKVQNLSLVLPEELSAPEPSAEVAHKWSKDKLIKMGFLAVAAVSLATGSTGEDFIHAGMHALGQEASVSQQEHHEHGSESPDGDLYDFVQEISRQDEEPDGSPVNPTDAEKILSLTIPYEPTEAPQPIEGGRAPIKPTGMPSFKLPFHIEETTQPNTHLTNQ